MTGESDLPLVEEPGVEPIVLAAPPKTVHEAAVTVPSKMERTVPLSETLAALRAESTDDAGPKVIALAEHYPVLKTNENFLALQRAIADVENDLAVARGFEAAAVAAHRTRVESFPDSWLAPTVATA